MTTSINFGKCRLCLWIGKLYGRQCWRCRKRTQMRACVDCHGPCTPGSTRCLRCSNAYQATLRGRPKNFNHDRIFELFEQDVPISKIASIIGCTKNTISGYCHRQGWKRRVAEYTGSTSMQRVQALHDRLDAVMAETAALRASGKLYQPAPKLDEAA